MRGILLPVLITTTMPAGTTIRITASEDIAPAGHFCPIGFIINASAVGPLMSAVGHELPRRHRSSAAASPPKAAAALADRRVRFGPQADPCTAKTFLEETELSAPTFMAFTCRWSRTL
jgi:hypothetical protein